MTARWNFFNPVRIEFGRGCLAPVLGQLSHRRLLLVTTPGMTKRGQTSWLRDMCSGRVAGLFDGVMPKPTLLGLDALASERRPDKYDGFIAKAGGSALDTEKVLAD